MVHNNNFEKKLREHITLVYQYQYSVYVCIYGCIVFYFYD